MENHNLKNKPYILYMSIQTDFENGVLATQLKNGTLARAKKSKL